MYAIVGITGNTGGVAAKSLLEAGKQVRGVLRDPSKAQPWRDRGAEIAIADLTDPDALTEAFAGVDGVYVMTPPYTASEDMFGENSRAIANLKRAIIASATPKVVFLSSIGAQRASGTGEILKAHAMEEAFFALPVACAAIRAAWFMENFLPVVGMAREQGSLPSFLLPLDRALPMAATVDIGKLAAHLLAEPWSAQRVVELEGPRRYSPLDVAQTLSTILARDVSAAPVPRESWTSAFQSMGFSPSSADAMTEMLEAINSGKIVFEEGDNERVAGETTLETVLRGAASG